MPGPSTIANGVHWVGTLDPELRTFDLIMETEFGTTYNAYLVVGEEHVALIDTTKHGFEDTLLDSVRAVIDPARIDYLVVNHTEPDHAGAVKTVLDAAPNVTVVGTKRAMTFLGEMLNETFNARAVKAGETLELGGKTLRFVPSPFVHWPDTMSTYLEEEKLLFSCDLFGAHYCPPAGRVDTDTPLGDAIFDDALTGAEKADLAKSFRYYYDTIMGPFPGHVTKAVSRVSALDIAAICPSHGPVLREGAAEALEAYRTWSAGEKHEKPQAAVCFASIYGYTRRLADALAHALEAEGVDARLIDMEQVGAGDVAGACCQADVILLGTPTLNGGPAPQALDVLSRIDHYRAKGKLFVAFGSYGWSGEAVEILSRRAQDLKMKLVGEGMRVTFNPSDADLEAARDYARQIAEALR